MKTTDNVWTRVQQQLQKIGHTIELDPKLLGQLSEPENIVQFTLPLVRDDNTITEVKGLRVQHNSVRGPYKGGLRFHQEVSLEEMKTFSLLMTIKNSLINVPFGGGKGGLMIDPKTLSERELEQLTRLFAKNLAPSIGPETDIPAPDVNTNGKIMSWIVDEYKKHGDHPIPHAVVTGKPLGEGGSEGRTEATGLGGAFALLQTLKHLNKKPEGMTVAVQGFGNVGYHVVYFLQKHGMKVVAVSDSKGGIYAPEGMDVEAVQRYREEHRTLKGSVDSAKEISSHEILTLPQVDVVIPAALEEVITPEVAHEMKAKIVLEMANAPTTAAADVILEKKNILVIPDILANAGGVAVSYFEWLQNMEDESWTKEKVFSRLQQKMDHATDAVFDAQQSFGGSMREAAYTVALKRIEKAWKQNTSKPDRSASDTENISSKYPYLHARKDV